MPSLAVAAQTAALRAHAPPLPGRRPRPSRLSCVAQAAGMTSAKPVVHYFPIRGRAEVIRIALSAAGVDFDEADVDRSLLKVELDKYPFGQCPRYTDSEVDIVQSNAILRHLGRKHSLYGESLEQMAQVDVIMDAVEDLRRNYRALIYVQLLTDDARAEYFKTHLDPSTSTGANRGAHMSYFENALKKRTGKFIVGNSLSIADIELMDIIDLHMRIFGAQIKDMYPNVASYHADIMAEPKIKAYVESHARHQTVNGNGLG